MILALDTSTRFISLALAGERAVLAEVTWLPSGTHTVELAPAVERMLKDVGVSAERLTAAATAIGPGSFTGVRIGLAFTKGLAMARRIPLIGVRTLDITVRALSLNEQRAIAVLQAGRGRVVWARYQADARGWVAESNGVVGEWGVVASHASDGARVIGEIDSAGYDVLQRGQINMAKPAQNIRRAAHLAEIAWERLRRGEIDDAATLKPIYVHQPTSGEA